jgi:hypothetical protein
MRQPKPYNLTFRQRGYENYFDSILFADGDFTRCFRAVGEEFR